jgi:hypothetical protein
MGVPDLADDLRLKKHSPRRDDPMACCICSAVAVTDWPIGIRVMVRLSHFSGGFRFPGTSPPTGKPVCWPNPKARA